MQSEVFSQSLRSKASTAKRVVIKIGTNVLFNHASGDLALDALYALVDSIRAMLHNNVQVVVVSSGAVAMGATRLSIAAQELAVCAAAGQSALMALYEDAFTRAGLHTAQLLLTSHDFENDQSAEHLKSTLESLLALGTVPVVNENDVTSSFYRNQTGAVRFGDNDMLAALLAAQLQADLLILLTDVDGLYNAWPRSHDAKLISELAVDDLGSLDLSAEGSIRGRGGIKAKLNAVFTAVDRCTGLLAFIANGRIPGVLEQLISGCEVGTVLYKRGDHE
jgi:glutamate 5-kinase